MPTTASARKRARKRSRKVATFSHCYEMPGESRAFLFCGRDDASIHCLFIARESGRSSTRRPCVSSLSVFTGLPGQAGQRQRKTERYFGSDCFEDPLSSRTRAMTKRPRTWITLSRCCGDVSSDGEVGDFCDEWAGDALWRGGEIFSNVKAGMVFSLFVELNTKTGNSGLREGNKPQRRMVPRSVPIARNSSITCASFSQPCPSIARAEAHS